MILHDFIYEWDGKTDGGKKPISWWPGAYHVKIIGLSSNTENVSFLIPTIVILKNAKSNRPDMNTSLKNYIHPFARRISEQYNLDIGKTLWVELEQPIRVTRIPSDPLPLNAELFALDWRPIRANEMEMIRPYLDDM